MDQLLTYQDLAEHLQLSERSLQRMVAREEIPYIRLPSGAIRFYQSVIEEWVQKQVAKPAKKAPKSPVSQFALMVLHKSDSSGRI
jgi:excisionase family DNA binding protein